MHIEWISQKQYTSSSLITDCVFSVPASPGSILPDERKIAGCLNKHFATLSLIVYGFADFSPILLIVQRAPLYGQPSTLLEQLKPSVKADVEAIPSIVKVGHVYTPGRSLLVDLFGGGGDSG